MPRIIEPFISVGIDVSADFSDMAIALPTMQFLDKKSFRIHHNKPDSRLAAVEKIKKAEEEHSMKARIFMESTGIYHYPLFCFFKDAGFEVDIINPLITYSNRNSNIRKVKNDDFDAKNIAKVGFDPNLKVSNMPHELIMNFRNLTRVYYYLTDVKSGYVLKLGNQVKMAFPQFKGIYSELTGKTSMMLLKKYTSPQEILEADPDKLAEEIAITSRNKPASILKCAQLIDAATDALEFGYGIQTNFYLIKKFIQLIEQYEQQINDILKQMKALTKQHKDELFVKQVKLLESMKGIGFLSALTLMCEIGDFSAFGKPKQLFAYFGLDPSVNQSGKFKGSRASISKRGSSIARRVLHTIAIQTVGTTKKGIAKNPVLRNFYHKKLEEGKARLVALVAVSHKICNIIYAMLRDHQPYVMKTPEQHRQDYNSKFDSNITTSSLAA